MLTARRSDTFLSPAWGVIIAGEAVDLTATGWAVHAHVCAGDGTVLIDFGVTPGTDTLFGTADFKVGDATVTTSTVILYASPAAMAQLPVGTELPFEVEIEHPTYGPLGDQYRVTIVSTALRVLGEIIQEAP